MKNLTKLLIAGSALPLLQPLPASAGVLVYEGFNYGGTAGAMNGKSATGTGLTGSYATVVTGTASANYQTTSLSFSSNFFASSGGSLLLSLSPSTASNEGANTGVQLNAGTSTGTLYASALLNIATSTIDLSTDSILLRLASTQNSSTGSRMNMAGDSGNSANNMAVSYASATSGQTGTAGTLVLSLNTTYLMLGKWTNVGVAGGGTATMWILNSTAYDNWISTGGGLEANLDSYATGKTQRSETTQIDFDNSSYLQLSVGEGGTAGTGTLTGTFDEVRFAADFNSVAVPEPSPSLLLGVGLGGAVLLYLRRKQYS